MEHGDLFEARKSAALSDAGELLRYLRDRDAWCPVCRYNLRGLTVPRCPECGRGLRLAIRATEPVLGAWIFLAFTAFAMTGLSLLAYFVLIREPSGWRYAPQPLRFMFVYVTLSPFVAGATVIFRHGFCRAKPELQWTISTGYFALCVVILVIGFQS
jgi:hypothetical protein